MLNTYEISIDLNDI